MKCIYFGIEGVLLRSVCHCSGIGIGVLSLHYTPHGLARAVPPHSPKLCSLYCTATIYMEVLVKA